MMGFPLPTQELYEVNQRYWDQGNDWSQVAPGEAMERQDRAYRGTFKKWLRQTDQREMDHNVSDNRCEPIVATGVDFLLGEEVTFEVMDDTATDENGDPTDQTDETAQEYLDAVWEANVKMPTLSEEEINKAVFGHGFIKLDPQDSDMPPAPGGQPIPALLVLNPMQMQVKTLPTNIRKVQRYAQYYTDEDDETGATIYCRQLTVRLPDGGWEIHDQVKQGSSGSDMTVAGALSLLSPLAEREAEQGWQDVTVEPWPYTWSPIHDGKNLPSPNSYWGKADLTLDLIHLNDVINFQLSNINSILYHHAHAKPHYFGIHARELQFGPGDSLCIPNIAARVELIQITADGLEQARAYVDDIRLMMDELSHVPSLALGHNAKLPGVPSGVALKVACRPLVSQTLQKRNLRAAVYTKLCQHILEIGGFGADRKVVIHWSEMLPTDELTEAQSAQIWHDSLGVSQDSVQQRGDWDPDVEKAKRAEEDAAAMQQQVQHQAQMAQIAAPGQSNGQAVDSSQPSQQAGQAPQQQPTKAKTASKRAQASPRAKKTAKVSGGR